MRKNNQPTDALIAITYNCNARCIMCNIWKEPSHNELSPQEFAKIPTSLKDINITGGEPFLRKDIVEITGEITLKNPKVRLVFSSNGFLSDKIIDDMVKIKKVNHQSCIAFSIDGDEEMHSQIRGIPNAYKKVFKTIDGLKKSGINDIRLAFTTSRENAEHLPKVYNMAKDNQLEFTMSVVHNSDNYFNIDTNITPRIEDIEQHIEYIVKNEFKTINPRKLLRTYFMKGLSEYVKTNKRPLACMALDKSFFLDPQGQIFACNMLEKPIGNLREERFETIWNSQEKTKLQNYCKSCNNCWMVCTAKSSIRKNIVKVAKETVLQAIPAVLSN